MSSTMYSKYLQYEARSAPQKRRNTGFVMKKQTFGRLGPVINKSPGPAYVVLPSLLGSKLPESRRKSGPAFSFGYRTPTKNPRTVGPGPARYDVSGLAPRGKNTPLVPSLKGVPKAMRVIPTPAPGHYLVEDSEKALGKKPQFSFGIKPRLQQPYLTPAPNRYQLPTVVGTSKQATISSSPAFSLGSRTFYTPTKPYTPGPGEYNA